MRLAIYIGAFILPTILAIGGFYIGKNHAYESFVQGECWLNAQTRDIDCVKYVGK